MKTAVGKGDALLRRAKRLAKRVAERLRALVEGGLRRILGEDCLAPSYELPDRSIGRSGGPNPLENYSWQQLRDEIYGGRQ